MKTYTVSKLGFSGVLFCLMANVAQATPLNYQDCLLFAARQGLVGTKEQAKHIEQTCRQRFPKTAPSYGQLASKLPEEVLARIDIWTKRSDSKKRFASVYNGNSDIVVTELVVLVSPRTNRDSVEDFFDSEEYEVQIELKPFKTTSFGLPTGSNLKGELKWQILSAKGY